jgi:hypothetical protein
MKPEDGHGTSLPQPQKARAAFSSGTKAQSQQCNCFKTEPLFAYVGSDDQLSVIVLVLLSTDMLASIDALYHAQNNYIRPRSSQDLQLHRTHFTQS